MLPNLEVNLVVNIRLELHKCTAMVAEGDGTAEKTIMQLTKSNKHEKLRQHNHEPFFK